MGTSTSWERTQHYLGLKGDRGLPSRPMRLLRIVVVVLLGLGVVASIVRSDWIRLIVTLVPLIAISSSLIADYRRRVGAS